MVFLWAPAHVLCSREATVSIRRAARRSLLEAAAYVCKTSDFNRIRRLVGNIPGTGVVRKRKDSSSKTSSYVSIALLWFPRIIANIGYLRGMVLYE